MVWKCPPLHLPNWNNLWKWKQEMNAYELAHKLTETEYPDDDVIFDAAHLLCKQADNITKYRQVLESIANERVELSHDKIKWQCEDHIKWAKDVLK